MNFHLIADDLNVQPLKDRLVQHPELFGLYDFRKQHPQSPHRNMTDIWLHYNDIRPYIERGDFTGLNDPHEPIWYPVAFDMPEVFPVVMKVMEAVGAKRLGFVLITKVPPGGRIEPHVDGGWHAKYFDKYYVPILNNPGSTFNFPDGVIAPTEGEAWWFRNDVPHWVINDSDTDRIAMIVCIEPNDRFANDYRNKPLPRTEGDL